MRTIPSLIEAVRLKSIPVRCTIELSARCNQKCPHCYVTRTTPNKLSLDVITDLFDQLADIGTFGITLTGGEIGLRKDLFEIIKLARQRYFAVYLLSNGTCWGPKEWDLLAELGVTGIHLTVFAMDKKIHDGITQIPGSFDKTMATILGLHKRGVEVECSVPILKYNVNHIIPVLEFAKCHQFSIKIDPNITCTDTGDPTPKKQMAPLFELENLWATQIVNTWVKSTKPDKKGWLNNPNHRPCGVGELLCFIKSSGKVFPCIQWPQAGGSILEQQFIDIYRESPVFLQARSIMNADLGPCTTSCIARKYCGNCAAFSLRENGSLAQPCESNCANAFAMLKGSKKTA